MSTMSYISVLERYRDYRDSIEEILASIASGVAETSIFENQEKRCQTMASLAKRFPFMEVLYVVDQHGTQLGDNATVDHDHPAAHKGDGISRSQRPYFQQIQKQDSDVVITSPYLSIANRSLCVTVCMRWQENGKTGYILLDADLMAIIEFLMGDAKRRKFQPLFRWVYIAIVTGLFLVVAVLLNTAFTDLYLLTSDTTSLHESQLKPFGVIIFLTLALAIFDLGKTTLEEEVLMHKDIFRHSSTRRTITRFVAAILIAVSIEALLLMFKSALGYSEALVSAVWMMMAAVGLLIGLGLYVYLGAKAEELLRKKTS